VATHCWPPDTGVAQPIPAQTYSIALVRSRGLIAEIQTERNFSQQANILAVLYGRDPKEPTAGRLRRMLAIEPEPLRTASERVLLLPLLSCRALDHAGLRRVPGLNRPLAQDAGAPLQHLAGGSRHTRSDSHAWSAHPIYDLLTLVAGIELPAPASPPSA